MQVPAQDRRGHLAGPQAIEVLAVCRLSPSRASSTPTFTYYSFILFTYYLILYHMMQVPAQDRRGHLAGPL